MQQFQSNRPSPQHGGQLARKLRPRWLPGLEYCPPVNQYQADYSLSTLFTPGVGANLLSSATISASNNTRFLTNFDAHGPVPSYTGTASGDESIHTANSVVTTPSTAFSMSAWVKFNVAGDYHLVFGRGNSSHTYGFAANHTGAWSANADPASGTTINISYPNYVVNVWYHAVMVLNGSTLFAYLDGKLVGTTTVTGFGAANAGGWQICGGFSDVGNSQPSSVRYPMTWLNRALTASDVYELYINPSPYSEGSNELSIFSMALIAGNPATDAANPTLPYVKSRHGGTGHGNLVRAVSADTTCNLDDYVIECSASAHIYLPTWSPPLQSREFVIVNTGNSVTVKTVDGAVIIGANSGTTAYQIPPGVSVRFIAGSAYWIKI